jgi:hypothetical protein
MKYSSSSTVLLGTYGGHCSFYDPKDKDGCTLLGKHSWTQNYTHNADKHTYIYMTEDRTDFSRYSTSIK